MQAAAVDPEAVERLVEDVDAVGLHGRDDDERALRLVRQVVELAAERALDARARRQRRGQRLAAGELAGVEQRGDLDQRERVAAGRRDELLGDLVGDAGGALGQQRARRLRVERGDVHPPQAGRRGVEALAVARGEDEDDALGADAPRGEEQRLERRGVEPVDVVDDGQQRLVLGGRAEQAEHGGGDGEAVVGDGLAEGQRPLQRRGLGGRDRVDEVEQRAQQVEQAGERDVALGLVAARAQDAEVGRRRDGGVEQRALADPGLAVDDEHRALALAGRLEDGLELALFAGPSDDHGRAGYED